MQKVKRFFRSIQFKIPVLFIFMLMISLQLIVANFLRQLETQMISNFQEQIQLQVGFLKNSVQPIVSKDDKDEVKIAEISKILQDYPTGSSIVEARVLDSQGYILGTTNQSQQSVVGIPCMLIILQNMILVIGKLSLQFLQLVEIQEIL